MKKILFITDISPLDKNGAGTNGNAHRIMINNLEEFEVYNFYVNNTSFNIGINDTHVGTGNAIQKISSWLTGYPYYISLKTVDEIICQIHRRKIDIVFIDNSVCGKVLQVIKKKYPNVKIISFFHDIEIYKMKEDANRIFKLKLLYKTFAKNERLTVLYSDRTVVLNARDRKLFVKAYGKEPDYILPVCIPSHSSYSKEYYHIKNTKLRLLFVGVDYYPNVNGIRWFINNVMNYLNNYAVLSIVGRGMEKYANEFNSSSVNTIGTVDNINEYYQQADVIIAPIFQGGGMKVKTGEALMNGKIILGTEESLMGYYEMVPSYLINRIIKCNDVESFVNSIKKLFGLEFQSFDKDIYLWAEKKFSYDAQQKIIYEMLFSVL